ARNFGMDQAKGEYVIFPDPDDVMENNYLEGLISGYQNADVDLSICGHYVTRNGQDTRWNPGAVSKAVFDPETALQLVMRQDSLMGYAWNKLYKMELIRRHGIRFCEEHYVIEDLPFAVCYIGYCRKIAYDPTPLYHYSRDNGGLTLFRKKLGDRELSGLKAYKMIAEMTRGKHPAVSDTAYASLCERSLRFMTIYLRTQTDDPAMFRMLHRTFLQYWRYFMKSDIFTRKHKCAAAVAVVSPRMYYRLARRFGHMRQGK
nr:glycosyltransferase [Lachnospiraceae bacterium]